ncbi:MAG: hypothetical protein WC712_10905 [Candidatus Brocadiia bacterium]
MFRRTFAIALLTAVFCCTLSIPKADEPPADSLAKFLPADTILYVDVPDLMATGARAKEAAISRLMEEGDLMKTINEALDNALAEEDNPPVNFAKVSELWEALGPRLQTCLTGRAALTIPAIQGDMPVLLVAFKVADGKDKDAEALLREFTAKFVETVLPPDAATIEESEYKGARLLGILDKKNPHDDEVPWSCVSGGYILVALGRSAMNWMLDALANPPAENLLGAPAFRKSYAAVKGVDLHLYFSFGSLLRNFEDFRSDMTHEMGPDAVACLENATVSYGMTLNKLAVEDELCASLDGKQWPFPIDLFSDTACRAAAAKLFPEDTSGIVCVSLDASKLLRLRPFGDGVDSLAQAGIDVEGGLVPLLGPEVALGVIARGSIPTGMIAVELKDAKAAKDWFTNLTAVEAEWFNDPVEVAGGTLFSYKARKRDFLDLPRELRPLAFGVMDGWLLYGPVVTVKNQMASKATSLAENADFTAAVPPMLQRQPQVLAFVNFRSIVKYYYPLLVAQIQQEGEEGNRIAMALPTPDRVEELAIPMVLAAAIKPDSASVFASGPGGFSASGPLIAAIAIPNMIGARRTSNVYAAMATCKAFGSCAVAFSQTRATQDYWGSGTTDFAPFFTHVTPKGGYKYRYFSNSSAPDVHDATKFIYLAIPLSTSSGLQAFYIDESQVIFGAASEDGFNQLLTPEQITALNAYIDKVEAEPVWERDDNTRIEVPGVTWVRR